ncbi:hypothetical protein QAD02_018549 [Eretmocerus hayati]|uniref:Uncharacterized protein n=1 Tax=Eretmocerus hayati TaxID=131215 RepID=A0ACC2PH06_9HYME|nr:hypothetical protein QAD02_018549 [Eretmocerus hayati]
MSFESSFEEEDAAAAAAIKAALAHVDVERLPPRQVCSSERRSRWVSRNALIPMSPHQLIDGRIIRSSLLLNRRRRRRRALRFPENEVAGCLEPDNPWRHRKDLKRDAVITAYKEACDKHKVSPLQSIIFQLKSTNNIDNRCEELSFKGILLHQNDCEALEEVFRRILFFKVDLDGAIAEDNSAEVLFQIFEFYEATAHIDISNNRYIGTYGWQACSRMLRKTTSLKRLDATNILLNEEYMTILTRGLRYAYLIILRLDSCKLSGRPMELLVIALKFNMALRQLYLGNNGLQGFDCQQIGTLLKFNSRLAYLDLSDNLIQDDGMYYVAAGLTNQLHFGKYSKSKRGLESLILWNNQLTRRSATHINAAIKRSKTLKYLNIGSNILKDDTIMDIRDSLVENKVLLRLDMQSTDITCFGLSELARVLKVNNTLQTLDLRNNPVYKSGVLSLAEALEINKGVTEIYIDEKSKLKSPTKIKAKYSELVKQLHNLCERNKELINESATSEEDSEDQDGDSDEKDESAFGEDELDELEESQEELPQEYKRYMTWRV